MHISKKFKNEIRSILLADCKARDDDCHLAIKLLEIYYQSPMEVPCMKVLTDIQAGRFPAFKSLTRIRRKLQELNPALRGYKYLERMRKQEEIKKELERVKAMEYFENRTEPPPPPNATPDLLGG